MKRIIIFCSSLFVAFVVIGAGLVSPPLSPVAGTGGGGPTNGQTAAQVSVLINDTNVNRIQPLVDSKIATASNALFSTNQVFATNQPFSAGQALVVVGTNASGQPTVKGTNWPSGGGTGTLMPPNAIGVLTNNGSGTTNWSAAFTGTWVASGTLPKTAADSSWMSITNAVAFSNSTGVAGIGKGLVVIGTNSYGAILTTDTNWPSGGSDTPWSVTHNANINDLINLRNITQTNGSYISTNVQGSNASWYSKDTNNVSAWGTNTSTTVTVNPGDGSITANVGYFGGLAGTTSIIPTNAAAVFTVANVNTALPMGLTNTFVGRAEPLVQYYMIDAVAGTPKMTISNETTGVKILLSTAPLTGLTQTNFTTLPITSTNSVWRIRDESTGSGASVGIITNWLTGL